MTRRTVVAAVLAAGSGKRLGGSVPKQLLPLAGRLVLHRSVAAFRDSPAVDRVVVVAAPDRLAEIRDRLDGWGMADVETLPGGVFRHDSTWAVIEHLGDLDCDLLVHDAARPLVDGGTIGRCVDALADYEAVTVAVPSTDTVVVVDDDGILTESLDRSRLRRVQTPQGFRLATIRAAHVLRAAHEAGAASRSEPPAPVTDDCGVVRRYLPHVPVRVVEGSERNLKITHAEDLLVADALLNDADSSQPHDLTDDR